jgi:hypothetical protein
MGVPLKTEKRGVCGKDSAIRGSARPPQYSCYGGWKGGRRGLSGTCQLGIRWRVPRQRSARLTHSLKLDTAMWLLRCSVFGGTPMAFMRLWCIFL